MESNDKDSLFQLFAGMPDEQLPFNFNEKVMRKVRAEAASREKKRKYLEFFGYASGIVAVLAVSVFVFYFYEISIELPKSELPAWSFPKPDFGLLQSPSFHFSLFIGVAALFLLIVDSSIRRHIEKTRNKQQDFQNE
jgi:hypothetical protein